MRCPPLPFSQVTRSGPLEAFLPEDAWYTFRPYDIHGLPHVTRVLFWSSVLTNRIGRSESLRWRELYWSAALHDLARIDDGVDRGHGTRAAHWVDTDLAIRRPETAALDIGFIAELCRWHEVSDDIIGRWSLELMILKDADGLDRCRINDLDPQKLRLQASLALVEPAERLEHATSNYGTQGAMDTLRAAESLFPRSFTSTL